MENSIETRIETRITKQLGIKYPLVGAPMFLWSNVELVRAVSNAGGIGMFPALNYRTFEEFDAALDTLKDIPYGVNVIVNKAKQRQTRNYLSICKNHKTPIVVTSLGSPKEAIELVHGYGGKVWSDVIDLDFAAKVAKYHPDAIVGVIKGAGGHHGYLSGNQLIPKLRETYPDIPILQGGKIADAETFKEALDRGAEGAYIGTRFLASLECHVHEAYKQAIVKAQAEDIVSTNIFSGAECTAIRTPTLEKIGIRLKPPLTWLLKFPPTKKLARWYLFGRASGLVEKGAGNNPYYHLFVAGEAVGRIKQVEPVEKIVQDMVKGYFALKRQYSSPRS